MAIVFYERMPTDCGMMRRFLLKFAICGLATVCLPVLAKLGHMLLPSVKTEAMYKFFLMPAWVTFIGQFVYAYDGIQVRALFYFLARESHACE